MTNVLNTAANDKAIGLFCEVAPPIVNGVVASVASLRDGLAQRGIDALLVAPRFGCERRAHDRIVLPSLPLPTRTRYRLVVPYARIPRLRVVHAHSAFVAGALALRVARAQRTALVFTYHTQLDAYAHYAPFAHGLTRELMRALTRRFANAADVVVAPTHAIAARLRALGVVAPIAVVPSAVDVARFAGGTRSTALRERLSADPSRPLALAVGRLGREKNLELAVDAVARDPALHLAVVGEGPERGRLERRAAAAGPRIRFVGALPPARLPDVYASADVLAAPSRTETQGLTLVEALAAGLPVVALDGPVAREVLGPEGWFAADEPAAFAAALADAAQGPRGLGRVRAEQRFGVGAHAEAMLAVYASVQGAAHLAQPTAIMGSTQIKR